MSYNSSMRIKENRKLPKAAVATVGVAATVYGAYRLGKYLTGKTTPKRAWKSDYGRHGKNGEETV